MNRGSGGPWRLHCPCLIDRQGAPGPWGGPMWLALAVTVTGLAVAFWLISETLLVSLLAVA